MAAPAAPKAKGTRAPKPRLNPFDARASEWAQQGQVPKTNAKGDQIASFKQIPAYFNKATGGAGKDRLQLKRQAFSRARAVGRELVFLINPRVVGTRQEIEAQARLVNQDPNVLLRADNVITEASLDGAHAAYLQAETARIGLSKGATKAANAQLDAQLALVSQVADQRKALKGKLPKGPKSPKGGKGGKSARAGAPTKALLDRYNAATKEGKALVVSKLTSTGVGARQVAKAPGAGSKDKNAPSGRFPNLYSDNEATYRQALASMGLPAAEVDVEANLLRAQLAGAAVAPSALAMIPQAQVGSMVMPAVGSLVRPASAGLSAVPSIAPPVVQPSTAVRVPSPVRVATQPLVAPRASPPVVPVGASSPARISPTQIPAFTSIRQ